MRHIAIKIVFIIIFLTAGICSFGQNQQSLKNGLVAATNKGVYYLQDGCTEWVQFTSDTTIGISYHKDNLNISELSINTWSDKTVYGRKIVKHNFNTSAISGHVKNTSNRIRTFSGDRYQLVWANPSRWMLINVYKNEYYNGVFSLSDRILYTSDNSNVSLATDNDTIAVVVGSNNVAYKLLVTSTDYDEYSPDRPDTTFIPGLHSRPADTHKVCYNAINDVFTIVSDSGIVYQYNKSTLSTIDTIPSLYNDGVYYRVEKVYGIAYNVAEGFYTILAANTTNWGVGIGILITSDFITYQYVYGFRTSDNVDLVGCGNYTAVLMDRTWCRYYVGKDDTNITPRRLIPNTGLPSGVIIYDIDYVNYLKD